MTEEMDSIATPMASLGLKSDSGNPVPLKSVWVDIHIKGYVAEVTSILTYYNEESDPIEAMFTFPVDDGSAVFQFEAEIQDRHIKAEIQEKEQAILTFKDAVDQGKTAMLLKEDNSAGDIFSCTLGNLPPKCEALLKMSYVIELPQEPDGRVRFTLPTILNPRYSPDVLHIVEAEGATYVPPSKIPYDFKMLATVQGYYKVVDVASDKTKLNVLFENENRIAKVSLSEDFKFDHDLQFLVQYEVPYAPQVVLEDGNPEAAGLMNSSVLMVSFHPHLQEVAMATNGEYIFLIDRSGSMGGDRIKNAKEALLLFIKSLPAECYFNIVGFGSTFKSLFSSGSKQYTEKTLNKALELIKKMEADLGGTEILHPLTEIFNKATIPGNARRVFVLTDGEVCNIDTVLGLVQKKSQKSSTRVFALGIGDGVSTELIKGIARNGNGKAEFIAGEQRIQSKVVSLLKCAMQPAITDVSLTWDLPPDVTPICIPTELPSVISAGERLTVFAILQGVNEHAIYAQSHLTLKGEQNGCPVEFKMNFTLCAEEDLRPSAPVHRLATKTQIKLLQDNELAETEGDRSDWIYGNRNNKLTDMKALRQKIIDLSCHGNIVSKYTAFVAIDTEGKKVESKAVQRSCPIPTLSEEFVRGIQETNLRCSLMSCGLDSIDSSIQYSVIQSGNAHLLPATCYKSKKKSVGLFCGPSLSKVFKRSKKKKSFNSPSPAMQPQADEVDAVNVIDLTEDNEDMELGVDTVDSADVMVVDDDSDGNKEHHKKNDGSNEKDTSHRQTSGKSSTVKSAPEDSMLSVISLQKIYGSWEVSEKLLQLLDVRKENFEKLDFSHDTEVVCTIAVLCWLRKHLLHRHEEWQMIEAKALGWLSSKSLDSPVVELVKKTTQVLWTQ